jgi:LL-H family phage holin
MNTDQLFTLITLLMPLVVFLAGIASHFIFARLSPNQQQAVQELAHMVVPAVEQSCSLLNGEGKRQEATRLISELLQATGVKNVPTALISTAIEAAVYGMNQSVMNAQTAKMPAVQPPQK